MLVSSQIMDTEEISKIKTAILKIHNGNYAYGIALLCSLVGWTDKGLVDFARKGGHPRGDILYKVTSAIDLAKDMQDK